MIMDGNGPIIGLVILDNHISKTETLSCQAIDMFFVELVYDVDKNKKVEVRSFKSGWCLDKYSINFNTEYQSKKHLNNAVIE